MNLVGTTYFRWILIAILSLISFVAFSHGCRQILIASNGIIPFAVQASVVVFAVSLCESDRSRVARVVALSGYLIAVSFSTFGSFIYFYHATGLHYRQKNSELNLEGQYLSYYQDIVGASNYRRSYLEAESAVLEARIARRDLGEKDFSILRSRKAKIASLLNNFKRAEVSLTLCQDFSRVKDRFYCLQEALGSFPPDVLVWEVAALGGNPNAKRYPSSKSISATILSSKRQMRPSISILLDELLELNGGALLSLMIALVFELLILLLVFVDRQGVHLRTTAPTNLDLSDSMKRLSDIADSWEASRIHYSTTRPFDYSPEQSSSPPK